MVVSDCNRKKRGLLCEVIRLQRSNYFFDNLRIIRRIIDTAIQFVGLWLPCAADWCVCAFHTDAARC